MSFWPEISQISLHHQKRRYFTPKLADSMANDRTCAVTISGTHAGSRSWIGDFKIPCRLGLGSFLNFDGNTWIANLSIGAAEVQREFQRLKLRGRLLDSSAGWDPENSPKISH